MVLEVLDPNIVYNFCSCWHSVPGVILGQGAQIVSAKIAVRKYPA